MSHKTMIYKTRITLDLTEPERIEIDEVREILGHKTRTKTLKTAAKLLAYWAKERGNGEFFFKDEDGNMRKVHVIL